MTRERLGRSMRRLAIIVGAWTAPALVGIVGYSFGQMAGAGSTMRVSHYVAHSFALWYSWIPATPVIFWIHRHRRAWWRSMFAHAATLAAVFALQSWLTVIVGTVTGHVIARVGVRQNLAFAVTNLLSYDALIYVGVVVVAVGVDYARRYRDRDVRAAQLETQLERARLESLQMQLQPHFLFNALNAIAMLIRCDRKAEAVKTVVGFGELLRYVLAESATFDVPLAEELDFVTRYLEIARVRFGDSLHVSIHAGAGAATALVPNLLMQPIVENALKHGIGAAGGHISIRAECRGSRLRLECADDGAGLPSDVDLSRTDGIGLSNLRQRLDALYGDRGSFTIRSRTGRGTVAVIEIPFQNGVGASRELMLAHA
jgi:two-component system LytT family sensor kinase